MLIPELIAELRCRLESGADCDDLIDSLSMHVARLERANATDVLDRIQELTTVGERTLDRLTGELRTYQRQRNLEQRYGLDRH